MALLRLLNFIRHRRGFGCEPFCFIRSFDFMVKRGGGVLSKLDVVDAEYEEAASLSS